MHELEVLLSRLKMEHLSYRGKRRLSTVWQILIFLRG